MGSTPTSSTIRVWCSLAALLFWEQAVAGSNPATRIHGSLAQWLELPPFKRTDQSSSLWRPTKSWAFGRTVMLLTLNQADTGSTPVAPTKFCPCDAIGRRVRLKPGIFASSSLARGMAEMKLSPFACAGVAQWQSN